MQGQGGMKKEKGPQCSTFRSLENSCGNPSGRATGLAEHSGPLGPF